VRMTLLGRGVGRWGAERRSAGPIERARRERRAVLVAVASALEASGR
jgi:hypothetical protein